MCEASRFASGNQAAEGSLEIKKQLWRHLLEDSSLLILFVCFSAPPCMAWLGFYCDDWRLPGQYTVSPQQKFVVVSRTF